MPATTLDQEIQAFERLLPAIRQQHGLAWALVANRDLVGAFPHYADAARYAREHYGSQEVLIRHTGERRLETAPFVQVHVEG